MGELTTINNPRVNKSVFCAFDKLLCVFLLAVMGQLDTVSFARGYIGPFLQCAIHTGVYFLRPTIRLHWDGR